MWKRTSSPQHRQRNSRVEARLEVFTAEQNQDCLHHRTGIGIADVMEQMLLAGMNVARLNFSHGDFESHKRVIDTLRSASRATGRRVAIMADLSGPKMRIGKLKEEPVELKVGDVFTLTTKEILGDVTRASVSFSRLPKAVKPGDALYLNDGFIQLEVSNVDGDEVRCKVVVGGELRSRKGLNLPDIDLGITAFTDRDRECLRFAMEQGVDAVSQSFVESGKDIKAVREGSKGAWPQPLHHRQDRAEQGS